MKQDLVLPLRLEPLAAATVIPAGLAAAATAAGLRHWSV